VETSGPFFWLLSPDQRASTKTAPTQETIRLSRRDDFRDSDRTVLKTHAAIIRGITPRLGLQAKIRFGLSKDGQWVTLYLPGNMGKISNHINAWKHILKVPYEKKNQAA